MRRFLGIIYSVEGLMLKQGGDRQGGLACFSSWGLKESYMTERLKWTDAHRTLNDSHSCFLQDHAGTLT